MSAAAVGVGITILLMFRAAHLITRLLGDNGNRIMGQLIAFLLLCIGVQVLMTGIQDVLTSGGR
jgi:multiple antibiotic resistance protein